MRFFKWVKAVVVRGYTRMGAGFRRLFDDFVDVADLAVGIYDLNCSAKGQHVINYKVYDYKCVVSRGRKLWAVVSEKPLLRKVHIVADGATNKVAQSS